MLHTLNAATGEELQPPFMFHTGKGWASTSSATCSGWRTRTPATRISAVRLDDPQHKVMNFNAGSGGAWGRRGAVIDSTGAAWTTTGDGIYDPDQRSAAYANSVVGVQIVGERAEAEGLLHADQLGLAAQARSRSEQHADDLQLQGTRADGGLRQGMPRLPARSEVARRRRSPDAALQDAALLQRGSGLPGCRQLGRDVDVGGCKRHALGARAVLGPGALAGEVPDHEHAAHEGRRRRGVQGRGARTASSS